MAEALVSLLIEQLASFIRPQIEQEVRLIIGVEKEVENLTLHLEVVQAVLQNAEERQVQEPEVRIWLENLKDVSYDVNNVLDEWNTEILKRKIEKQVKGESAIVTQSKVRFFNIPSPCVCFGPIGKVSVRRDIAKRIKELNERLTLIANLRRAYGFQRQIRSTEQLERPKTTSFADVSWIMGRENEKDILISKLLSESSQEVRSPLVIIPIVGMGGIGKTSLAQLVFNEEKVKTHFDKRVWVCVSDPFEEIKIARAIIAKLNINDARIHSNDFQILLECISECIEGKKFLLILDDVWNPSPTGWGQLKAALQNCVVGSRIVVTTRKEDVPIMLEATHEHLIHLKELSEKICLSIFYDIVLLDNKRDDFKLFEDIGNQIVKRCKGLPLAAKTLGSLMRYKKTKKEWEDVLGSKIWELKEVEQEVFQPLLLSYYDLTPEIKCCLFYCGVFPKDYVYHKDVLIEMWMSQDYLNLERNKENQTMIGQSYFDNLAMRSFFQDFETDDRGNVVECKMHDIVHDFVQFLTKNECFIMESNNAGESNKLLLNSSKVRHLRLMFAPEDASFLGSIYNCQKLRTLAASGSRIIGWKSNLIVKLKCLRTLDLSHNSLEEVPKEIDGHVHLRYLDLSGNPFLIELPDTVGNLYNLQTLRLTGCSRLEKLPETMRRLINLKHLYIKGCGTLILPKEMAGLTGLQRLDEVSVGAEDQGINYLGSLRNMDRLQGSLGIRGLERLKDASEAKEAQLVNKKLLLELELIFGDRAIVEERDEEILNALQPNTNLEDLRIIRYNGTKLNINWLMSLHNLTRLRLQECYGCGNLPALGKLASLEFLEIGVMPSVEKVGAEFLGLGLGLSDSIDDDDTQYSETKTPSTPSIMISQPLSISISISFPKLKRLRLSRLDSWEEWEGVDKEDSEITIMPSLSSLEISNCYRLKTLPDFLWKTPLQNLSIVHCPALLGDTRELAKKTSHIPKVSSRIRR